MLSFYGAAASANMQTIIGLKKQKRIFFQVSLNQFIKHPVQDQDLVFLVLPPCDCQ